MSYIGTVSAIKFGILSPDMIREMSVAEIQNPDTYDEDGLPVPGGVMDPRLGTLEPGQRCKTCGNTYLNCPGHFGHIELPVPVIHVGFAKHILNLLKATCRSCGRLLLSDEDIISFKAKIEEMKKAGKISRELYYRILQKAMSTTTCPHCDEHQLKIELEKPTTFIEITNEGPRRLTPHAVRARLERIPDEDLELLDVDPKVARPEWMVLTVLPVPPVYVRPSITLESGFRSEDDLTHKLVDILRVAQRLRENINAGSPSPVIAELADLLQYHVTTYLNNEVPGVAPATHRSGRPLKTLAQRLKGKEGRFRLNLSGKRVDFSARTVISPDPNIGIDEVGVPLDIAMQLTVPERVVEWNIERLRQYVKNGPDKYPGAKYIIRTDGKRIRLKFAQDLEEVANTLEPGFIVERHLIDGDIVLFNRQPSLHRMSIMAHRVKVLPYKTFRLNLCVCTPYNADFDGDEMNLHVPQSEEAQTEAKLLLIVQNNILSPRYGAPIIGAIRDFITALYLLTKPDTYLTKKELFYILSQIRYLGELPEPEIRDPEPKWSGRQVFSLLLPKGFNHRFKASFSPDTEVVIEDGKLVKGVIDKNAVGVEKANSILHRVAMEYGSEAVKELINNVVKIANTYLNLRGFSFGIDDLYVPREVYQEIENIFKKMDEAFITLKSEYEKGKIEVKPGETLEQAFESNILSILADARNAAGKVVRKHISPESSAVIMTRTGARGSLLNIDQMVAVVGQQAVRRERIKRGFTNRVLTFFKPGDLSPKARGFVYNSFLKGLDPIEFFFHMAGGRDGLVDTAVRTQQSGYMQRRLINALESLYVEYDGTVRMMDSKKIVQFLYGEDGIDPSKSYHGEAVNLDIIMNRLGLKPGVGQPLAVEDINKLLSRYEKKLPKLLVERIGKKIVEEKFRLEDAEKFVNEVYREYLKNRVEPGEAVGIVTAQSIGEPSTQLTLRTFHFAGVREQSILLGLPRLIEIVDARKTPSTPIMRIPLKPEYAQNKSKAQKVLRQIQPTYFEDIVSKVSYNLKKNAIILQLDEEAMKMHGVRAQDIEEALEAKYGYELKKDQLTIYAPEESVLDLEKLKEKILSSRVKGVRRITKAMLKYENGEYVILTEGSNLREVMSIPEVDHRRVWSNNIHEIAEVLGIEAAREAIVREMKHVLDEQGLDVDIRHLLLLADVMMLNGSVKQVGRHGVVRLKSSPLARASFEISVQTLLDAAVRGEVDTLRGNVERILIGKEILIGTGQVTLLMKHPGLVSKSTGETQADNQNLEK
ncbi:MAG: DNA-directed RNA polymerase subunit A' [Aigarchaeota archaeon]|nr:DNA-directed RNA polymerase subunit A' [Aigarchaeota archaeon]MCX8192458.1 DNA-directed RNA polymerase subunit A' [Nitrososphaeria archaeon]MDW7986719.1 DNA-directed RNA polymerase subunit A' [Nitrososphaerota archaeon]